MTAAVQPWQLARLSFLLPLLVVGAATTAEAQTRWQVDSASVRFEVRNAGLPVRGSLSGLQALVRFDPALPDSSRIVASVEAATIETGIGLRDEHLRRRGYFDVERYPRIRVESVRFARGHEPGTYAGTFVLEIKGTRREVALPFTFSTDGPTGRFTATFTIDRLDFGIGESSIILADDVTIRVDVMASRATRNAKQP